MVSVMLWFVLACGGGEPTVELPAPFAELGLPVGTGEVKSAEDRELHVVYTDRSRDQVYTTWVGALESDGWTLTAESPIPHGLGLDLEKEGEQAILLITGGGKHVDVLFEVK